MKPCVMTSVSLNAATGMLCCSWFDGTQSEHYVVGADLDAAIRAQIAATGRMTREPIAELRAQHPPTPAEMAEALSTTALRVGLDQANIPSEMRTVIVQSAGLRWLGFRGTGSHRVIVRPPPTPGRDPGQWLRKGAGSWTTAAEAETAARAAILEARIAYEREARAALGFRLSGIYIPPRWPAILVEVVELEKRSTAS